MNKKTLLIFIALLLASPWFWVFARNLPEIVSLDRDDFYQANSSALISEINTYQSQARAAGAGILGKLVVNKGTWFFKDMVTRFLESYDFHYLFMEGDLSLLKSTRSSGPIFLSLLPIIALGLCWLIKKRRLILMTLILLSPAIGGTFRQHYETLSRLPFIFGLTWLAALGITRFSEARGYKFLKTVFVILLIFEYFRFVHYYFLHYPLLLSR